MISTMIVDIDHLLATPIYQADRCSINFHPLHSYFAIAIYIVMSFLKRPLNLIGIGLVLHMFADYCDCFHLNYYVNEFYQFANSLLT